MNKTASTDEPANFRPTSIISVFVKLFDIILKQRISEFLIIQKVLNELQYAYRSGSTTVTVISKFCFEVL